MVLEIHVGYPHSFVHLMVVSEVQLDVDHADPILEEQQLFPDVYCL